MNPCRVGRREVDHALRQRRRRVHAESHGFAMQEALILRIGFERVSHGVPEVQDAPQIAFALVRGHHFSLDAHRIGDNAIHRLGLLSKHAVGAFRQHAEQLGVANHAALDDFVQSGAVLALGQSFSTSGSISTTSG